jgi:maleylpyruvate isomerase
VKLYSYWRSSASWRARIALAYKGVAYEYVAVHLIKDGGEQHGDAYRAVNPMQQVPTLELDDGRRISQSLAIIEYLEETAPRPALLPAEPYLRARARQLAELVNAGIQPLQNTGPLGELKARGVDAKQWAQHFIGRGLDALEASAAATSGRFLVGDEPTVADVCLVPQLHNARRFGVDVARWPLLARVEEACARLQPFQMAQPDRQPDAVATPATPPSQ